MRKIIRIHGGEPGARDVLERAMNELLRAENEPCDDDLQAELDEQERQAWKFISDSYEAFYVDALEDIKREIRAES